MAGQKSKMRPSEEDCLLDLTDELRSENNQLQLIRGASNRILAAYQLGEPSRTAPIGTCTFPSERAIRFATVKITAIAAACIPLFLIYNNGCPNLVNVINDDCPERALRGAIGAVASVSAAIFLLTFARPLRIADRAITPLLNALGNAAFNMFCTGCLNSSFGPVSRARKAVLWKVFLNGLLRGAIMGCFAMAAAAIADVPINSEFTLMAIGAGAGVYAFMDYINSNCAQARGADAFRFFPPRTLPPPAAGPRNPLLGNAPGAGDMPPMPPGGATAPHMPQPTGAPYAPPAAPTATDEPIPEALRGMSADQLQAMLNRVSAQEADPESSPG